MDQDTIAFLRDVCRKIKDPEEFVMENGLESFRNLVQSQSQSRARWLAWYYSNKNDLKIDLGRYETLSEIASEYVSMADPLDKSMLKEATVVLFGLSKNDCDALMENALREKKLKDEEEKPS